MCQAVAHIREGQYLLGQHIQGRFNLKQRRGDKRSRPVSEKPQLNGKDVET